MKPTTEIFLYGSLNRERKGTNNTPAPCMLQAPTPLPKLLFLLGIQPERVQLVMVNHRAVSLNHEIQPGDRVALFPREYAIFADWKDLRF